MILQDLSFCKNFLKRERERERESERVRERYYSDWSQSNNNTELDLDVCSCMENISSRLLSFSGVRAKTSLVISLIDRRHQN